MKSRVKFLSLSKYLFMNELEQLIQQYYELGIDRQLDYDKFYLYSIITHSTAIEGSTITELENQIMFDNGIAIKGKSLIEQNMNLDLKNAYERVLIFAHDHCDVTMERLKELSALTMKNTGVEYHTTLGDFSSAHGDLRLVNVSAGAGGKSYMAFNKVPQKLKEFCDNLNRFRREAKGYDLVNLYNLSFDAHFHLVTIHPWADGNGRMARLLMNWLQFEYGLIPSRILAADKEDYIKALVATREEDNLQIFRDFMHTTFIAHLKREIELYKESVGVSDSGTVSSKLKTNERIISYLASHPRASARELSQKIGITVKGIEKQLASLKAAGRILRIGPAKGGYWQVD